MCDISYCMWHVLLFFSKPSQTLLRSLRIQRLTNAKVQSSRAFSGLSFTGQVWALRHVGEITLHVQTLSLSEARKW